MNDSDRIQTIITDVLKALPPTASAFKADLEKTLQASLQDRFARWGLVTREEFDAQCRVLERTRELVDQLQEK